MFQAVRTLSQWMFETVSGKTMGRIMIVNLEPRGRVPLHVDPKDYFEMYSRFHVPLKTNPGVVFNGENGTANEHMPLGYLSRLNNRLPHQLDNNSDENRIHLIVDIETEGGNQIF
jgi:aspartyl/asparaginyl beta-hydroxylase (cupin superfamily)